MKFSDGKTLSKDINIDTIKISKGQKGLSISESAMKGNKRGSVTLRIVKKVKNEEKEEVKNNDTSSSQK